MKYLTGILIAVWLSTWIVPDGLAGDLQARLSWQANSETDLAGYKVYQSTVSGQYGAPITTLGTVVEHTVTLPEKAVETTYYFTLTAYDQSGQESGKSAEVRKVIPALVVTPKPGTVSLIINTITETSLIVSHAPVDDGTGNPAKVDVRISAEPVMAWGSASSQSCPSSPCTMTGLRAGTQYQVQAVAFRPGTPNVFGPLSAVVSADTLPSSDPVPDPPKGLIVTQATPSEVIITASAIDCPHIVTSVKGSTSLVNVRTVRCEP